MIKILMLTHYYFPHIGGNEGQCRLLSENLARNGYQITVITKKYKCGLPGCEIINSIKIYRIFCLSALTKVSILEYLSKNLPKNTLVMFLVKLFMRVYFYLDEFLFVTLAIIKISFLRDRTDIIHAHQTHWIAFGGAVASKLSNKPLLIKDATLNGFKELKVMPFSDFMEKTLIKTAYFSAISSVIYKNLTTKGIKSNRLFLVSNGVTIPPTTNNYLTGNFEILFVGNYIQGKIKGIDILLQAIPTVIRVYPQAKLLLVGEGNSELYNDFFADADVWNNIEFLGSRDVTEYYRRCAVFVLPSRSEGMSNALLEAMSFGMPCISSNVSGSNDLIQHNYNGLLIESENSVLLAEALLYLFANRESAFQLGKNARKSIIANYQIDRIAKKYCDIYNTILEN